MAQKNRPTLKQQFSDFINRVAPFDGNPLIQKTEHLQVKDDLFDSLLGKVDNSVLINSPGDLIALDFDSVDLYRINTSGSVDTDFTFTPSNIGTGQIGRIHIIKKSNDTFLFSNAVIVPISNLDQTGTTLVFYLHNINGVLVASSDLKIQKSDAIDESDSNQLATSKAINDLSLTKLSINRFNVESLTPSLIVKQIEIGDWNMTALFGFNIPHLISDAVNRIRSISVSIRRDDESSATDLTVANGVTFDTVEGRIAWTSTTIFLSIPIGGFFDSTDFNSTSFNRGWILITYEQ